MIRTIFGIGEDIDIEKRDGGFMRVTILPGDAIGVNVVVSCERLLMDKELSIVSDLPESASCANCTHPTLDPEKCLRRPDEDHFIVGGDTKALLERFALKTKQVCPAHSSSK